MKTIHLHSFAYQATIKKNSNTRFWQECEEMNNAGGSMKGFKFPGTIYINSL